MVNNKTLTPLEEIIEAIDKLEKIDESVLTPAQVLKASHPWVKAIIYDIDEEAWVQCDAIPDFRVDCDENENIRIEYKGHIEYLHLNIHFTGDWKDSLFVKEKRYDKVKAFNNKSM